MSVSKAEQKVIDLAIKRSKLASEYDNHNRKAAIEDLKFVNGDQWDSNEKKRRSDKGRPALQINLLPKYIDQVVGDMLHNTPSIKVRPVDSHGDVNIAKIRQGIIANIEYNSNSKGIYSYAAKQMVASGYGAWRVLTRYMDENPFAQEIYLEGIRNPFLVYMDPTAKDQNYADAKWGFVVEKMSVEEFEERWPKASKPTEDFKFGTGLSNEGYGEKDLVTVVEYLVKEDETVEMVQMDDGRVLTAEEFDEIKKDWKKKQQEILDKIAEGPVSGGNNPLTSPPTIGGAPGLPVGGALPPPAPVAAPQIPSMAGPSTKMGDPSAIMGAPPQAPPVAPPMPPQAPAMPPPPNIMQELDSLGAEPKAAKRRETKQPVIRHRIMTACEILEGGKDGNIVAGKFIPIVLLKGKELNIEGKNYVYSLIRHAKDPQKLINYWNTAAAETIALAPKAPWLMTPKQIEGHEEKYAAANIDNNPVLLYNVDSEAPGPPNRVQASQAPVAIFEQIRRGEENLKSVIGMFNADVGAPGSEQTGAAITARQKPGDVATFEFSENLARAVNHTGRIINEMIPEIYDTEQDARIRHIDESESFVPVNTTVGDALKKVQGAPDRYSGIDVTLLYSMFSKEGKDAKFNDITAGKYDIVVTTGPSYSTQRQESAQHLLQLVQAMPQQMALAADLIVENLDFKDSDELAARIRKTLPPNIVKPRKGEPPPPPPQPNPQVLLAQAKLKQSEATAQLIAMKSKMEETKIQSEHIKLQVEMAKAKAEGVPEPPDPLEQIRIQMEQDKRQHEKVKMQQEQEINQTRIQTEKLRLNAEIQKQQLSVQQARELHQAKMAELQAQSIRDELKAKREEKVKKDPLKLRKK